MSLYCVTRSYINSVTKGWLFKFVFRGVCEMDLLYGNKMIMGDYMFT